MKDQFTFSDIKILWPFILAFTAVVIWGVRLESMVSANNNEAHDKGSALRDDFERDHELLLEINERTIRMEEKQDFIIKSIAGE